ncbi:sensor histidine kinase [Acetobacter oeni]|uniref:histidine kinase n=2 Tax=Acetobacter oeni TaxID=304077 RepID=A0A511XGD8_9PROT|nr:sensor histidine kinase [Acetobacter oeni]MBB3881812.1 two-component sensor histidine kinase [Acetobacter oeni]GEN62014.1 histidine kinase [Acetobacter oeni]
MLQQRKKGMLRVAFCFARLFDSVRARMATIIIGSVLPVAILGTILIWQDYGNLSRSSERRSEIAVREIDQHLRHDAERTVAMLQTLSDSMVDDDSARRLLQLAQSASGTRYCLLAIVDSDGAIAHQLTTTSGSFKSCESGARPAITYEKSAAIWVDNGRPYLSVRVPVSVTSLNRSDDRSTFLIAIEPLDQTAIPSQTHFSSDGGTAPRLMTNAEAWLMAPDAGLVSLCSDCGWPPPDGAIIRKLVSLATEDVLGRSSLQLSSRFCAYGPVGGVGTVVVEAARLPQETRTMWMLGVWIALVLALLLAGLAGVMIAGHRLVIHPLRRLTEAVQEWERAGAFDASVSLSAPQEYRKLAWAFGTATRRLARREQELQKAVNHQKILLGEIHHRVKNNLQIVASLLSLQGSRIRDDDVRQEFMLARDRVRTLETLHRHLYVEGELESLNMNSFLDELSAQLLTAAGQDVRSRIVMHVDAGGIVMAPDQATSIALIVSEVVSNALKFAFPGDRHGTISISMSRTGNLITLIIADDGIGLSTSADNGDREGIGLQLIRGFARQISASLRVEEGDGTRFIVEYSVPANRAPT